MHLTIHTRPDGDHFRGEVHCGDDLIWTTPAFFARHDAHRAAEEMADNFSIATPSGLLAITLTHMHSVRQAYEPGQLIDDHTARAFLNALGAAHLAAVKMDEGFGRRVVPLRGPSVVRRLSPVTVIDGGAA